jgi:hypothetical protein
MTQYILDLTNSSCPRIVKINATERQTKRPREDDYTVQRPLKFIKIY